MKKSFKVLSTLAFVGTALLGMTACSSSDDNISGSENANNDLKQYVAVNIQSVQSAAAAGAKAATRAKNDTYEDGTADEQKSYQHRLLLLQRRWYTFPSEQQ